VLLEALKKGGGYFNIFFDKYIPMLCYAKPTVLLEALKKGGGDFNIFLKVYPNAIL
jgi:hypothetical protein